MHQTLDMGELAPSGEGLAWDSGRPVFVPFTAAGDRAVVDVPAGEGAAHATLVEVLAPGPARVVPPCPHFGHRPDARCGGCEWLHLTDAAQLGAKERGLAEALRRIGKLPAGSFELRPIVPSPLPLRYRSRAKFHHDRAGRRLVFFRRRSHEAVPVRECHLLELPLDALRAAVGPALAEARLDPREISLEWSEHEGRGSAALRFAQVTASTRSRTEALLVRLPALAGAVLLSDEGPPIALGEPVLRHERRPGEAAAGLVRSRPDAFAQANRKANAHLVETALAMLAPAGEAVLELFCGAGNFTAPLAALGSSVHAVEVQGPALDLARADAAAGPAAGYPEAAGKVRFFAGDALGLARAFGRETGASARRFRTALLDPPREGARGAGQALLELGVERVVYVSCDPATLARDLRGFVDAGFAIRAVQPVDMFPQTHHVEAVALLER